MAYSRKGVVQQFSYGTYTGGTIDSSFYSFGSVDENGIVTVKQEESSSVGLETRIWKWNNKQFVIAETTKKSWREE